MLWDIHSQKDFLSCCSRRTDVTTLLFRSRAWHKGLQRKQAYFVVQHTARYMLSMCSKRRNNRIYLARDNGLLVRSWAVFFYKRIIWWHRKICVTCRVIHFVFHSLRFRNHSAMANLGNGPGLNCKISSFCRLHQLFIEGKESFACQ